MVKGKVACTISNANFSSFKLLLENASSPYFVILKCYLSIELHNEVFILYKIVKPVAKSTYLLVYAVHEYYTFW